MARNAVSFGTPMASVGCRAKLRDSRCAVSLIVFGARTDGPLASSFFAPISDASTWRRGAPSFARGVHCHL
eukprot:8722753-Pyramimonas_sp.AAC.1